MLKTLAAPEDCTVPKTYYKLRRQLVDTVRPSPRRDPVPQRTGKGTRGGKPAALIFLRELLILSAGRTLNGVIRFRAHLTLPTSHSAGLLAAVLKSIADAVSRQTIPQ